MELPQHRAVGPESSKGRKATHDFLSLYSSSSDQQDPTPPSQGKYLKTHDFLQPLERKSTAAAVVVEKPAQSVAQPRCVARDAVRTDDNNPSRGSYMGGSTFTIWQEPAAAAKKGKTRKENDASAPIDLREAAFDCHKDSTFGPFSSSRASSSQGIVNMVTSAQFEEDNEELVMKREPTSRSKGNDMRVKAEAKSFDQKPNTPRSKHSATEQRRRSKINDRFQKLREIIPNSDQRRDKASFLFEVIEYVQFLQEKVIRHEASNIMQWSNGQRNTVVNPASAYVAEENRKALEYSDNNSNDTSLNNTLKEKDNQQRQAEGTIDMSSAYSRGLLNTLTKALQSSGVDLSQAKISVQIDLGKRLVVDGATEEEKDYGKL